MTNFETLRDEASKKYASSYEGNYQYDISRAFDHGADWARKDCAARVLGLVDALQFKMEPCAYLANPSDENAQTNALVSFEVYDRIQKALESFAKESL